MTADTSGSGAFPVTVSPSAAALAKDLGTVLADRLCQLSATRPRVDIAIAGGFVSQHLLPALARSAQHINWERIHVWWVDERYVDVNDPDRNDTEAIEGLFAQVNAVTLHRMPARSAMSLTEAGTSYRSHWDEQMRGRALDLVILGMGPDGHVASLFPERHMEWESPVDVVADSPKPPPERITLTLPVLLAAHEVVIAAPGRKKADAIAKAIRQVHGEPPLQPSVMPVTRLLAAGAQLWTDEAGAGRISGREGES